MPCLINGNVPKGEDFFAYQGKFLLAYFAYFKLLQRRVTALGLFSRCATPVNTASKLTGMPMMYVFCLKKARFCHTMHETA